jgi:hypothetical protein
MAAFSGMLEFTAIKAGRHQHATVLLVPARRQFAELVDNDHDQSACGAISSTRS